jgi:hypothetical protein
MSRCSDLAILGGQPDRLITLPLDGLDGIVNWILKVLRHNLINPDGYFQQNSNRPLDLKIHSSVGVYLIIIGSPV